MKQALIKLICTAFLLSLATPTLLLAQDEEKPPNLASTWTIHPKAGKTAEFMAAVAGHMAFRKEAGDSRGWNVYRPVIGDDVGVTGFRYCCFDWADEDAYGAEDTEKGLSDHWNANVDQYVEHYEHYLFELDSDNSHWNEDAGPFMYYGVTTWYPAPGNGASFDALKAKMSTLAKENGWANEERNWSWATRIGGKYAVSIAIPHEDYASMAPPEQTFYAFVVEQVGEEDANKMFEAFNKAAGHSKFTVWQHIKELSIDND